MVLCRQDSHTICAIQDRVEIDTGGASRFLCTICGRAFKDELVQEIHAPTDFGKRLLSGSRWMTIWVTELLIGSGIARDHIAWNAVAAEDELDIMTDALGPRAFFELKDRDFGLGDAYPFAYRVTSPGCPRAPPSIRANQNQQESHQTTPGFNAAAVSPAGQRHQSVL